MKPFRIAEGTPLATVNVVDPGPGEALPRERHEIGIPRHPWKNDLIEKRHGLVAAPRPAGETDGSTSKMWR